MDTRSPDVLLLDLILVGIEEGLIETERDLVRLYVWLCAVTRSGQYTPVSQTNWIPVTRSSQGARR